MGSDGAAARVALRGRGGSVRERARRNDELAAGTLDGRISEASTGWPADRLGALERNILRIALTELDRGDPPREVVIDEAVHLAKRYASPDAGRLVNGILGQLAKEAA